MYSYSLCHTLHYCLILVFTLSSSTLYSYTLILLILLFFLFRPDTLKDGGLPVSLWKALVFILFLPVPMYACILANCVWFIIYFKSCIAHLKYLIKFYFRGFVLYHNIMWNVASNRTMKVVVVPSLDSLLCARMRHTCTHMPRWLPLIWNYILYKPPISLPSLTQNTTKVNKVVLIFRRWL